MDLSVTDAARAVALIQDGRSQYYVARVLGVSRCKVQRAVKRFNEFGVYTRRNRCGRKKCTSERDNRFITLNVLRDRKLTSVEMKNRLEDVRQVQVSDRTIRRRLFDIGLRSRRPATGLELLRQHRVGRLRFAREHENWGNEEWSNILFTDESRFCLRTPDGRERIYRRTGERFLQNHFSPRVSYGGGSVMVWGGISFEARTNLVIMNGGGMTADRYIREVLEPHVVPFAPFIGDDFILMHDNARPHVARIVSEYLAEVEIPVVNWPALSPDLNPIEHVWDALGRKIRCRVPRPANLQQLSDVLIEEWNQIDQAYIQNLIDSMPRRIAAVIRARGGNTSY